MVYEWRFVVQPRSPSACLCRCSAYEPPSTISSVLHGVSSSARSMIECVSSWTLHRAISSPCAVLLSMRHSWMVIGKVLRGRSPRRLLSKYPGMGRSRGGETQGVSIPLFIIGGLVGGLWAAGILSPKRALKSSAHYQLTNNSKHCFGRVIRGKITIHSCTRGASSWICMPCSNMGFSCS